MFKKSRVLTIGMVSVALIAGLVAGSLSFGPISAIAGTSNSNENSLVTPKYHVNAHGQTYGSDMYVTSPENEPDLILAKGIDGTSGYIKRKDLNKDLPKNPQEAIKYMEKLKNGPTYYKIPLYAADGETIVGQFRVFNPESKGGQEIVNKQAAALAAADTKGK
jgi:hypothetical protein